MAKEKGEDIRTIEIELPRGTQLITKEGYVNEEGLIGTDIFVVDRAICFPGGADDFDDLLGKMLSVVLNSDWSNSDRVCPGEFDNERIGALLIQILEEKLGIPVKTCYTCQHFLAGSDYVHEKQTHIEGKCYEDDKENIVISGFKPLCCAKKWTLRIPDKK